MPYVFVMIMIVKARRQPAMISISSSTQSTITCTQIPGATAPNDVTQVPITPYCRLECGPNHQPRHQVHPDRARSVARCVSSSPRASSTKKRTCWNSKEMFVRDQATTAYPINLHMVCIDWTNLAPSDRQPTLQQASEKRTIAQPGKMCERGF
ncbi:hypothetical protein P153DRAFT_98912 [Dothidotthia symphoricarpi CBS 119687]|uniref:Uncharacterized protein n=1 Tax=Dothidotthia symphoricarpi CBS 119687 TaxID=1392245 RepID=A0A6A6APF0_9PLEO|nr:uncharacterized protein P153DRAFT_98912 [Dothidotthia symphoricarpi CBS 119687]KAF2133799.1 hypothetical protein P153DRAFT_98912 [Dothidotthia symphoricarpi CBS 119687]